MAKQSKLRQPYTLYQRGDVWHIRYSFLNAQRERIQLRETCATTNYEEALEYAENKYIKLKQKANRQTGELEEVTIDEAFGRYMVEKGQYLSRPEQTLARLKKLKTDFAVKYLSQVTEPVISNFININRNVLSNSTINRYIAIFSVVVNTAEEEWKVKTYKIKLSKFKLKEPAENIKYIKDMETAQKIIDRAAEHLKPIIQTAIYTGMRQGNILSLKWNELDFENNTINIKVKDRTKQGGKNLSIPMADKLRPILLAQPQTNDYVFNYNKKPIKSIDSAWLNIFYKRLPKEIKYTDSKGEKKIKKVWVLSRELKDSKLPYINFHALRHTAATWILKKTNNLRITKDILGHSDIRTTLKYAHVLDDEKRKAINSVFN